MTWEETIIHIRELPEFQDLIENAYYSADLPLNVERFRSGPEFAETVRIMHEFAPGARKILDLGAGNGVSSLSLALAGYEVTALEPDASDTIGCGAIEKLAKHYGLRNLLIQQATGETMQFPDEHFDIVYARQSMHHAHNLNGFVGNASRVLRKTGLFFTVRDHVIFNQKDKEWFLRSHPLHKYYGGENAHRSDDYRNAIVAAGLEIKQELGHFENVINYFPMAAAEVANYRQNQIMLRAQNLRKKVGRFANVRLVRHLYDLYLYFRRGLRLDLDERMVPGRLHSFVCIKR